MKNRIFRLGMFMFCLMVSSNASLISAQGRSGAWYGKSNQVEGAVAFSIDALYYFGDIEAPDYFALFKDFSPENMSASLNLSYLQPVHRVLKMRYSLGGGLLRGEKGHRIFNTLYGRVGAGVEYHPLPKNDFYVYGGLGFNCSFIDYTYYGRSGEKRYASYNPQFSLEVGYNFHLEREWLLGVHLGSDFNFLDRAHMSLDAIPSPEANWYQGNPDLGDKWADSYFYLGLTVIYDWTRK